MKTFVAATRPQHKNALIAYMVCMCSCVCTKPALWQAESLLFQKSTF